ncbi:MAG: Zn-dependent membrane protease YugP [Planctomycetota bacterium]|jgi:Zn-dependent membrane protease YugP
MPYFAIFDPRYLLIVGPTLLLAAWASMRVKSTFTRYSRVGVSSGMTGAQAAAAVARAGGAQVSIERVDGFLSDHYDPRSKTLRLSPDVFDGRSVASIAVAAHEAGHAIQDVARYPALALRSRLVPVASIGSKLWIWIMMAGFLMVSRPLMLVGVTLLGATVLFQLVTLPVEFDASNRAKQVLATTGIVNTQAEAEGVSKVLSAAALTYVAGALTAVSTLLYYLLPMLTGRQED